MPQDVLLQAAESITKIGVPMETPEQSVSQQLKVIEELKPADNGLLLLHTGGEWVFPQHAV